jgi:membrane protein
MTSAPKSPFSRLITLVAYVERRFRHDGALSMASSLSYTSLLSLVPLLAIGLAILAAFPVFDRIRGELQASIFRYVVPQVGEQVQQYVNTFVGNAGKLTAAGVVGLAVTAVMLLVTIETSFNQIFRVATPRSPTSRLLLYWTALTLGPLLLGVSFSLSAWFYAAGDLADHLGLSAVAGAITRVAPTVLLMITFGLLYMMVPNRRVRLADAAIGGVAAAIAFAVLRWGFGVYVATARPYQSIYGAVATVPIFLFWMYLSWVVVLFGAELSAALPERRFGRQEPGGVGLSGRRRLAVALALLGALQEESRRSGKGRSRNDLLDAVCGEPEAVFLDVLERCTNEGLVVPTASGRFVLGRDLAQVTLADLVRVLDLGLGTEAETNLPTPLRRIADRLADAARAEAKAFDLPLSDVLDHAHGGAAEALDKITTAKASKR